MKAAAEFDPRTLKVGEFSELYRKWDPERKVNVLSVPLYYRHKSGLIVVPAGFPTDGDSVPRLPLVYLLFKGRTKRAAVVHDWLYYSQAGKEYADDIFYDAMTDTNVGDFWRDWIYKGVDVAGGRSYRKHAKAHAARQRAA